MALGDTGNATARRRGVSDAKFKRGMTVVGSAELVYQLTGSNMSSPQTAHLNAKARAKDIGFWVKLTQYEAIGWTLFLCWLFGNWWPLVGGGITWSGMWGKYRYAIEKGLQSDAPPTEDYRRGGANAARDVGRKR